MWRVTAAFPPRKRRVGVASLPRRWRVIAASAPRCRPNLPLRRQKGRVCIATTLTRLNLHTGVPWHQATQAARASCMRTRV